MKCFFLDNQRLKQSILECLPKFQKTALIFSIGNPDSVELISKKVDELRGRLWKVALSMSFRSKTRAIGIVMNSVRGEQVFCRDSKL